MKRNVRSATASTSASCGGHESGKQTFRTSSPRRERRGAHSAAQTSTRRMARAPHRRDGIGVGLMGPPGSFGRGRARLAVSAALRCSLALSPFPDHRQPSSPPAFYIPPTGPSLSFCPLLYVRCGRVSLSPPRRPPCSPQLSSPPSSRSLPPSSPRKRASSPAPPPQQQRPATPATPTRASSRTATALAQTPRVASPR